MKRRNPPMPPPEAFIAAADESLHADWGSRGFVGRDDLVADVLARLGMTECAVAGEQAERALNALAAEANPDEPIIVIGAYKGDMDLVLSAMERYPELAGLLEHLYEVGRSGLDIYDMTHFPEKGDALDAITEDTPLVIAVNIWGIDVTGDDRRSLQPGFYYNRENHRLLPLTADLGVPLLVLGDQPINSMKDVVLYHAGQQNPSTTRAMVKKGLKALEKTPSGRSAGPEGDRGDYPWIKASEWKPPAAVQANAEEGLALRAYNEEERGLKRPGGTDIGVARAVQLSSGKAITPRAAKRMAAYFSRHQVDKKAKGWGDLDKPTPGFVAWQLWGGDEARTWASRLVAKMKQKKGRR